MEEIVKFFLPGWWEAYMVLDRRGEEVGTIMRRGKDWTAERGVGKNARPVIVPKGSNRRDAMRCVLVAK